MYHDGPHVNVIVLTRYGEMLYIGDNRSIWKAYFPVCKNFAMTDDRPGGNIFDVNDASLRWQIVGIEI
jgi:hypothetical protein